MRRPVALTGLGWVIVCALLAGCGLPSDGTLREMVRQHREDFGQLARLVREDEVHVGTGNLGINEKGERMDGVALSPERRREYHKLIAKLYLPYGVFVDSGLIVMQAVNYGWAGDWDAKGYVYSTAPLPVEEGELGSRCGAYRAYLFRRLEGNWYLFRYCS